MSEIDKAIDQAVRRVTDFYERKITALTEQLREADLANVALAGEKRLLAEQLRELRERMEKIKARSDPNREQRQSEPQIVLDSIHAHACAALSQIKGTDAPNA